MKFVYAIAFEKGQFLMIMNPKRKGWEMPGGHVEPDETNEEAARREFIEETGQEFEPLAAKPMGPAAVFAGTLKRRDAKGEMEWRLFSELPKELAFPEVEYLDQIAWARSAVQKGRATRRAGASDLKS